MPADFPAPRLARLLPFALLLAAGCEPARNDRPLTDFSCDMVLSAPQGAMKVGGAKMALTARFTNLSRQPWPGWRGDGSRTHNILIGSRWLGPAREDASPSIPLFEDLPPGESVTVELEIAPPSIAGDYTLRVEPVQPSVAWFGDTGSSCVVVAPVTVEPR